MDISSLPPAQLQALLDGPALAPPPGVVPQLDNPPNHHTAGVAVQLVCIVVATLALIMRIYTKIRIIRQMVLADYAIILGWAVFAGYFVPCWLIGSFAAGVHQWDLRLRDLEPFLKYLHVGSVMYGICIFFVKLSILLQYLQIFAPAKKTHYMWWSCYALIAANFVFYFVSSFVEIWSCDPVAKAWDPFITTGRCINIYALNIAASSINTLSDLIILILPQLIIWRLHMSKPRRLGASAVFLIGVFATASSAVRLAYVVKLYSSTDLTYNSWFAGVWTYPEMTSGIVVACLPVSLRFFHSVFQSPLMLRVNESLKSLIGRGRSTYASEDASQPSSGFTGPKGVWSRAFAEFDKSEVDTSQENLQDNTGWEDGVYVMHSIDVHASSAEERGTTTNEDASL